MSETNTAGASAAPSISSDLKTAVTGAVSRYLSTVGGQAASVVEALATGVLDSVVASNLLPDLKAVVLTAIDTHINTIEEQAASFESVLKADVAVVQSALKADLVAGEKVLVSGFNASEMQSFGGVVKAGETKVVAAYKAHPIVVWASVGGLVLLGGAIVKVLSLFGLT